MVEKNDKDASLIAAINTDNWNDIYLLAVNPKLHLLRQWSGLLKDPVDSEELLRISFNPEDARPKEANRRELREWLEFRRDVIDNSYMYSLLMTMTFDELSRAEIDAQASASEELTRTFPDRWETYMLLAFTWVDNLAKSSYFLKRAQDLAPNREIVILWSMVLSLDDPEHFLEYAKKGYALHGNKLFLFLMAKMMENSGRAAEAKAHYQRIIENEAPDSYLSKMAKKELKSSCFLATLVYGDKYAPEVEMLRFVRDRYLDNILGRLLVRLYYRCSPRITESLRNRPALIRCVRCSLSLLLAVLRRPGRRILL